MNQIAVDVSNSIIALQQARVRYQAAVRNRVLSQQLLDAEQKKFALGVSTTFNVVQQQRDLATAQSSEVASLVALVTRACLGPNDRPDARAESHHGCRSLRWTSDAEINLARSASYPSVSPSDRPFVLP